MHNIKPKVYVYKITIYAKIEKIEKNIQNLMDTDAAEIEYKSGCR